MKAMNWIVLGLLVSSPRRSVGAEEGMKQMAKLKSSRVYAVESGEKGEDLLDRRGFGDQEPMVRMMNLMMVEGSGYAGMDMGAGAMKMAGNAAEAPARADDQSTTPYEFEAVVASPPAKVGANSITISIRDGKTKESKRGLKPKAQVYMTSMDMGTDEPRVREVAPGRYQVKATFSMKGPWAVKLALPDGQQKTLSFSAE